MVVPTHSHTTNSNFRCLPENRKTRHKSLESVTRPGPKTRDLRSGVESGPDRSYNRICQTEVSCRRMNDIISLPVATKRSKPPFPVFWCCLPDLSSGLSKRVLRHPRLRSERGRPILRFEGTETRPRDGQWIGGGKYLRKGVRNTTRTDDTGGPPGFQTTHTGRRPRPIGHEGDRDVTPTSLSVGLRLDTVERRGLFGWGRLCWLIATLVHSGGGGKVYGSYQDGQNRGSSFSPE